LFRRRHPATVQTPGREEVGEVHLEPLVSSPRLAWEQPLAPTRAGGFGFGGSTSGGGGFGFFRDQNQNLTGAAATPSQQQQLLQLDSKNGSNSSSDYLIWKALDATKYQR
jgi:hypothetical protein